MPTLTAKDLFEIWDRQKREREKQIMSCKYFSNSGCMNQDVGYGDCMGSDNCVFYKEELFAHTPHKLATRMIVEAKTKGKEINKKKICCYIAGPYRSSHGEYYVKQNIANAEKVAMQVRAIGAYCYVPHMNSAMCGGAMPDDFWLAEGLEFMKRCDCVVVQGKWQESEGTKEEIFIATRLGIPVFYWGISRDREKFRVWLANFNR